MQIVVADAADMPAVRRLIAAYVAALGIDLGYQSIEAELAGLPGAYAPPSGALLLARTMGEAGEVVGCVAVRRLGLGRCEMKRLYVDPAGRGLGAGRALAEAAIAAARRLGYADMVLDTLPQLVAARGLYERLGFEEIAPYYDTPVPGTVFMRLTLSPAGEDRDAAQERGRSPARGGREREG